MMMIKEVQMNRTLIRKRMYRGITWKRNLQITGQEIDGDHLFSM